MERETQSNKEINKHMNTQQAYITGFVKRASEYGFNENEALELLKEAAINTKAMERWFSKHPAISSGILGGTLGAIPAGLAGAGIGGVTGLISPDKHINEETGETETDSRLMSALNGAVRGGALGGLSGGLAGGTLGSILQDLHIEGGGRPGMNMSPKRRAEVIRRAKLEGRM